MKKEISIYYLNKNDHAVYYFDTEIENPELIESALMTLVAEQNKYSAEGFDILANPYPLEKEGLYQLRRCDKSNKLKCDRDYFTIDISEVFVSMATGIIENNGILTSNGTDFLREGELVIKYRNEIISPGNNCPSNVCWEKSLIISSLRGSATTPYFMIKNCATVSFCVKNLSAKDIIINLENSPNARDFFIDAQKLIIQPNKIGFITPYSLSKYLRLIACSDENCPIIAKVWFSMQLR